MIILKVTKKQGFNLSLQDTFFEKPAVLGLKKRLWHRCFPVNFAKFSRTPFL